MTNLLPPHPAPVQTQVGRQFAAHHYEELSRNTLIKMERLQQGIEQYMTEKRDALGANRANDTLLSQQLSSDRSFTDAIGTRNHYVQLVTMYATLAIMYRQDDRR